MSAFLAAEGMPEGEVLFWILVAMFGARNAAMAFNRIVDSRYDKLNPRTRERPLASGEVDRVQYVVFLAGSSLLFVAACTMLNKL